MMLCLTFSLVVILLFSPLVSSSRGAAATAAESSTRRRFAPIHVAPLAHKCRQRRGGASEPLHHSVVPRMASPTTDFLDPASASVLVSLRGGGNVDEFADEAYGWCVDLGSPAALIAGAVIAILYENARGGQLELRKGDTPYVKFAKKMTSILLLSAFALEIIAIFVTTVTGTMMRNTDFSVTKTTARNALEFMRQNFEFEYLTARLSFLQGLLNWLAAVAVEFTIPSATEGRVAPKMDQFVAVSLSTLILMLISFYNKHLTYYDNYFKMMTRWLYVSVHKFFSVGPMAFLYIPGIMLSLYYGVLAFRDEADAEEVKQGS